VGDLIVAAVALQRPTALPALDGQGHELVAAGKAAGATVEGVQHRLVLDVLLKDRALVDIVLQGRVVDVRELICRERHVLTSSLRRPDVRSNYVERRLFGGALVACDLTARVGGFRRGPWLRGSRWGDGLVSSGELVP